MHQLKNPSLTTSNKQDLIKHLFYTSDTTIKKLTGACDCYLEYSEKEFRHALQHEGPETQICTLQNVCSIIQQVKEGVSRAAIKSNLSSKLENTHKTLEDTFESVIDLAVRLYLMVYTGPSSRGVTSQTLIIWTEGNLKDIISSHFQHQLTLTDPVKFERIFNAKNMERIAGVTIQWTPNLVDHLRFSEDGRKPVLNIFHHARFLEFHQESNFFPPGLIDETIRTLSLLLPAHDSSTRKWFRAHSYKNRLDPSAATCGQLKLEDRQIAHFKYWHDRLVILKQYFDDSEPRTIKQWWFDDRKRVQWFWVAIALVVCTVLFGVVQCVEGGWQIWKAYHPST